MIKINCMVSLLVCTMTLVAAIVKDYSCGCGPHLYHPTAAGFETIYQLFGRPVYITANVTEESDRVRWGVDPGTTTLNTDDIDALRRSRIFETRSHYMDIVFVKKTLDGIQVFAQIVNSEGAPTVNYTDIHNVTIHSGEAPSATVETQVCENSFSICVNVTGTPHPSIIKRYKRMDRPLFSSHQRTRFCATVNSSTTNDNSRMKFSISNCFGNVIIVVSITNNTPVSTSSCVTSYCSMTKEDYNSTLCSIADITVSIQSDTRLQNCSMPNSTPGPTNPPKLFSRPSNRQPSPLYSSTASFAAIYSTSAVRKPILHDDRESPSQSWKGTPHISSAFPRNQGHSSSSTGSSPTLSWNGTMIAIHTSDVFPRNQGNISSSTKGLPVVVAATGAAILFILGCTVIFLWQRKRKRDAVRTYSINEQTHENKNRGFELEDNSCVAAETPQSIVHYDELPAEHQYARPVSPTKFSGRYGDGYDYLLPKKEVKLASGKSEQSRPDILLLYPETDQDQSEEAKIQDERSTNEISKVRTTEMPAQTDSVVAPVCAAIYKSKKSTKQDEVRIAGNAPIYAAIDRSEKSVKRNPEPEQKDEFHSGLDSSVRSELDVRLTTNDKLN